MGFTRDETARGVAEVRKRRKKAKKKKREGRKVAIFTRKCEAFLHALFLLPSSFRDFKIRLATSVAPFLLLNKFIYL